MGTEGQRKGWDRRGWGSLAWKVGSGGKQGTRQNETESERRALKSAGEYCEGCVSKSQYRMAKGDVVGVSGVGGLRVMGRVRQRRGGKREAKGRKRRGSGAMSPNVVWALAR